VFNNEITANNTPNFGAKGSKVSKVPTGTGVIVLAASYVEVFKNTITHNNSASVSIISYFTTGNPLNDAAYYPYTEAVTFTTTSSAAVEPIRPAVMPRSLRPSRENHCR